MLMLTRDEETGETMNDRQLRDEVMTLMLAGHETTATTLTWTWYLLSEHPDVARRLREELAAVLGGRTPTMSDVPNLVYTRMVIEESLRLYPPAWVTVRKVDNDDIIGGYHIPAGSTVVVSAYVLHRNPTFWPDPERFDPERFTPERVAERPRFAYIPFSAGPRQCIGNTFALVEAQLILATIAQRYHLDVAPGHRVAPEPLITLRPKGGMPVIGRTV
jgi:cytochrome P450